MKLLFYIFFISIISIHSIIPNWNVRTSAIDLLNGKDEHSYVIDHRNVWYGACDHLYKTIKRNNGVISHYNTFIMKKQNWGDLLYEHAVDFEAVESFYYDTHSKTAIPIVCPRGNYSPLKVINTTTFGDLTNNNTNWQKTSKFDLKCYFHRSNDGHFLVYYLMNGENHFLELKNSNLENNQNYRFDVKEIYDFKILNRPNFDANSEEREYPFIGLVKVDDELRLVGAKIKFFENSQTIASYKTLLKIKEHTQAYFHNYHFNNDFYYFTYNNIYDFSSGYSTSSIATVESPAYDQINGVTFKNNDGSPFEFFDEVEIIQMENIFNFRYVYYTIKNKATNVVYHGVYDIITNRIMFHTDDNVSLFIPYITFVDENGGYEHSNSMLMINNNTAYRVCAILSSDGKDCVDS